MQLHDWKVWNRSLLLQSHSHMWTTHRDSIYRRESGQEIILQITLTHPWSLFRNPGKNAPRNHRPSQNIWDDILWTCAFSVQQCATLRQHCRRRRRKSVIKQPRQELYRRYWTPRQGVDEQSLPENVRPIISFNMSATDVRGSVSCGGTDTGHREKQETTQNRRTKHYIPQLKKDKQGKRRTMLLEAKNGMKK